MLNTITVTSAAIIRQRSGAVPSFVRQNCAASPNFFPNAVFTHRIPPSSIAMRKHASTPNMLPNAPSTSSAVPPPPAAFSRIGIVTNAPRITS